MSLEVYIEEDTKGNQEETQLKCSNKEDPY